MKDIRFDMSKLTVEDIMVMAESPNLSAIIPVLDKTVVGGVRHRPGSDLPRIFSKLTLEISKLSTDTSLAVGSMMRHLRDSEDDN